MATVADLTLFCRALLQDVIPATYAWEDAQIRTALDDALAHWTRREGVADWIWVQGVQNQRHYPLNGQALFLQASTDDSGTTDNLTTVTDSTVDFTTTVLAGDQVRNYTDGSTGIITGVATTVLTCAAGFTGGLTNAFDTGDAYGVERPIIASRVARIEAVVYDGQELFEATHEQLDRLQPAWEGRELVPKYWLVDQQETPTRLTIVPSPRVTGSSIPLFPMDPFPQRYAENLLVLVRHHPQSTMEANELVHLLDIEHFAVAYEAVARVARFEGEWQHPSLAVTAEGLMALFQQLMERTHG